MRAAFYNGNWIHPGRRVPSQAPAHGQVQLLRQPLWHLRHRPPHLPRQHGPPRQNARRPRPRNVRHHRRCRPRRQLGWGPGDRVTVMPLDPCASYLPREGAPGEPCPACIAGHSHICMRLSFIGIDVPGALAGPLDRPRPHPPPPPRQPLPRTRRPRRTHRRRLPRRPPRRSQTRRLRRRQGRRPHRPPRRPRCQTRRRTRPRNRSQSLPHANSPATSASPSSTSREVDVVDLVNEQPPPPAPTSSSRSPAPPPAPS